MREVRLDVDARWWRVVPGADDAGAWFDDLIASTPEEHRGRVAAAAVLALDARLADEASITLLLVEPETMALACATIVVADDVAPMGSAAEALALVDAAGSDGWEPQVLEIELAGRRAHRVSRASSDEDSVVSSDGPVRTSTLTAIETTYVLDVGGRLAIASLSPAAPETAAIAAGLLEPTLATLSVGPDSAEATTPA